MAMGFTSKNLKLNYSQFPSSTATNFYLLQDFGGGGDGRVWLACSTNGNVCVIKFLHETKNGKDILEQEKNIWICIWNLPARVVQLFDQHALIIPYVETNPENVSDTKKIQSTKSAIEKLAKGGFIHNDLHWRHVGFYNKEEEIQAVLFDLVRVSIADPLYYEKNVEIMLSQLNIK